MTKQLWIYCGLAYAITWTIVLGLYALFVRGAITRDELNLYFNLGALGPFLAAVIAARVCYGPNGPRRLFATLGPSRLERRSLLLALSPLLLFAIGLVVHLVLTGAPFSFETTKREFGLSTGLSYVAWAAPFITYALFEELGWRGFALPHLQERHGALVSAAILAAIWALWHAPMFLFRFQFGTGIAIGFFFGILVGSIILTAIFNLGRGGTLAAIIFHFANNLSSAFDKEYIVATVSTGFVVIAAYLLIAYKPRDLADRLRQMNYFADP